MKPIINNLVENRINAKDDKLINDIFRSNIKQINGDESLESAFTKIQGYFTYLKSNFLCRKVQKDAYEIIYKFANDMISFDEYIIKSYRMKKVVIS